VYDRNLQRVPGAQLTRDFEATTMAYNTPRVSALYVNGVNMTGKTPITKCMAHMPLALLPRKPERALVICFGMGTTFRAAMSWGIRVDAVDLIPGVPKMFPVFHADAQQLAQDERGRIIVDDGRRFLARTHEQYDVITIDPPPPLECTASSLLYSVEFYHLARKHLKPGGILAHWSPTARADANASIAQAIRASFGSVEAMASVENWGIHFFASDEPLVIPTAAQLAERLPAAARQDLVEWGPYDTADAQFEAMLRNRIGVQEIIALSPLAVLLSDDRPFNEYDALRRNYPRVWKWWQSGTGD
jgi:spermidine synthase